MTHEQTLLLGHRAAWAVRLRLASGVVVIIMITQSSCSDGDAAFTDTREPRHAAITVVSLNLLSLGYVTSPSRFTLLAFECHPCWLNNAVTSRIPVTHAAIPILYTIANMCFYLFDVNISLILNSFCYTALSDKQLSLYVIRGGLNDAATLWIMVHPAVIPTL